MNTLHANWAGQNGNWYGHNNWNNYFARGGWGYGRYGWGGYWPWYAGWGLGLGWGWGYPYDYGYYYPDAGDYYYSYAPTAYVDSGAVADGGVAAPSSLRTHRTLRLQPPQTPSKGPTKPSSSTPKGEQPFCRAIITMPCGWQAMPLWNRRRMPRSTN